MSERLSRSAKLVQEALTSLGVNFEVVELPSSTRTAVEAAAAVGCAVDQIAKSILFRTRKDKNPVMVIASGSNRIDENRIADLLGESIEKADADYVREKTGFAIGGVPPIGHSEPIPIIIDEDLMALGDIWAAAGTPNSVFRMNSAHLVEITGGKVTRIKSQK